MGLQHRHQAGWSPAAQSEVEILRLVDCEGLTPLLALFSEATLEKGAEAIETLRRERELLTTGRCSLPTSAKTGEGVSTPSRRC